MPIIINSTYLSYSSFVVIAYPKELTKSSFLIVQLFIFISKCMEIFRRLYLNIKKSVLLIYEDDLFALSQYVRLHCLIGRAVGYKPLVHGFKHQPGYVWRSFHSWFLYIIYFSPI